MDLIAVYSFTVHESKRHYIRMGIGDFFPFRLLHFVFRFSITRWRSNLGKHGEKELLKY